MQLNKNCKPPVVCSYMQVPVLKTTSDEQLVNYFFNWKHPFPANEQSVTLLSPWRESLSCIPLPHYSFGRERRTMALQDMPFQRPLFTPCHIRILRGEGNCSSGCTFEYITITSLLTLTNCGWLSLSTIKNTFPSSPFTNMYTRKPLHRVCLNFQ